MPSAFDFQAVPPSSCPAGSLLLGKSSEIVSPDEVRVILKPWNVPPAFASRSITVRVHDGGQFALNGPAGRQCHASGQRSSGHCLRGGHPLGGEPASLTVDLGCLHLSNSRL
jgi:hypothetical protein